MINRTLFLQTLSSRLSRSRRRRNAFGLISVSAITLLAAGMTDQAAQAQSYTETNLHSFKGLPGDGANPEANLVDVTINGTEMLFGTTQSGGANGEGAIFSINPATQAETVVYSFSGSDGVSPIAGMINVGGILYGTTSQGGTKSDGTVFSFDPSTHAEKVLYSFTGKNGDGVEPSGSLINVAGILYGTTSEGGTSSNGTVFSINPNTKAETNLYSFNPANGTDGANPLVGLISVGGSLYGTTSEGGLDNDGTVYSINPNTHTLTIVYSFTDENGDGLYPQGSLINVGGLLYGTTYYGGNGYGIVFSIDPTTQAETIVYTFSGYPTDGANPISLIAVGSTLYGTTYQGGTTGTGGSIFSMNPNGTGFQTLHSFTGYPNDGGTLVASIIAVGGAIYGTTYYGGAYNDGTVFSLTATPVPPVAASDTYTTKYKTLLTVAAPGVMGNDNSEGSSPMTAALVSNVTHGTLALKNDGSFTYTPVAGFAGTDSFTYRAPTSAGTGNIATVTITVSPAAPSASSHNVSVKFNSTLTIGAPGVLNNADNGGSSPLTAILVGKTTHGTLTLNSDGSVVYTPATGYLGADSFTYQAVNAIGKSNIATVSLTVQPSVPTAVNNSYNGKKNTTLTVSAPGILGNDYNGNSSPMTATLVSNVSHGTLTLKSDGTFTYTPALGFTGTDTFTYQAVNSLGKSNIATATLSVQ